MIVYEDTYLGCRITIHEIKTGSRKQYIADVNGRILRPTPTLQSAEMLAKHVAGDRELTNDR